MTECEPGGRCELCGDIARPGRVLAVDALSGMAVVDIDGHEAHVALDLVTDVQPGQLLLVHQGFAIERVNP